MNNKIGGFVINTILSVLFIGILFLPAASMGFLGVEKEEQVLSSQSVYDVETSLENADFMEVGQTSPSETFQLD